MGKCCHFVGKCCHFVGKCCHFALKVLSFCAESAVILWESAVFCVLILSLECSQMQTVFLLKVFSYYFEGDVILC